MWGDISKFKKLWMNKKKGEIERSSNPKWKWKLKNEKIKEKKRKKESKQSKMKSKKIRKALLIVYYLAILNKMLNILSINY